MLNPSEIDLKPITIRPQDPYELVIMAINRIDRNYHVDQACIKACHRSTTNV